MTQEKQDVTVVTEKEQRKNEKLVMLFCVCLKGMITVKTFKQKSDVKNHF